MTFSLHAKEGGQVLAALAALWRTARFNVKARCIGRRCELFDASAPDAVLFWQDLPTVPDPGSTIEWTLGDATWRIEVATVEASDGKNPPGVLPSLAHLSVDDLLARYRDGQLDAQAVAALAHKARGAEQLQAQLRRSVPLPTPAPTEELQRSREARQRRATAENHVRAAAASVVAELGAACCCGLHLPGRVVRAVRDLAWRLATLKAVLK